MAASHPNHTALADVLHEALEGKPMKSLTVLAPQRDPFRMDSPDNHIEGKWFAEQVERIGKDKIHIRGIHYATLGELKPDGLPYTNTEADWKWLSDDVVKSARWLGYVELADDIGDGATACRGMKMRLGWLLSGFEPTVG